jgi:hypothetical protein
MNSKLIVITGGKDGIHAKAARRIPPSVTDAVFLNDSNTGERLLLARPKSTQEIWMFREKEEHWIPWDALSEDEVLAYYACAPRLHLVTAEDKVFKASA